MKLLDLMDQIKLEAQGAGGDNEASRPNIANTTEDQGAGGANEAHIAHEDR